MLDTVAQGFVQHFIIQPAAVVRLLVAVFADGNSELVRFDSVPQIRLRRGKQHRHVTDEHLRFGISKVPNPSSQSLNRNF